MQRITREYYDTSAGFSILNEFTGVKGVGKKAVFKRSRTPAHSSPEPTGTAILAPPRDTRERLSSPVLMIEPTKFAQCARFARRPEDI
jgi:hypothetical protein